MLDLVDVKKALRDNAIEAVVKDGIVYLKDETCQIQIIDMREIDNDKRTTCRNDVLGT